MPLYRLRFLGAMFWIYWINYQPLDKDISSIKDAAGTTVLTFSSFQNVLRNLSYNFFPPASSNKQR